MRLGRRSALQLLLVAGCQSIQPIEAPPAPPEGAQSAIVAFAGDALDVFAVDLSGRDPLTRPFSAGADAAITLLYLPNDLASMQLSPGRIAPAAAPPARSLPPFLVGYESNRDGELVRWQAIDRLSDRLAEFRMSGFSVDACAGAGGCYLDTQSVELEDCTVPCPVLPPAPPRRAQPPRLPRLEPCPPGWTARLLESLIVCEPSDLASLCPEGSYAEGLTGNVVRVDPNVTTIQDAIASAPEGATLALAKGVHAGTVTIDRALTLVGACAAETVIDPGAGGVGLSATAPFSLAGVTIRGGAIGAQIDGAEGTIEDSVVMDSEGAGVAVSDGSAALARVLIAHTGAQGLSLERSTVTGEDLIVRDTANAGVAMSDTRAALTRLWIERGAIHGINAVSSTVSLSDLVVHTVSGSGLEATSSSVTLARASLFDLETEGMTILGRSALAADDLTIADVAQRSSSYVEGLLLGQETSGTIHRLGISGVDGQSLYAYGDVRGDLEDVTIEQDGDSPDPFGVECGFNVLGTSQVTARRVHLEQLLRQGLCANERASVTVEDVSAVEVGDHGLYVFSDASLTVRRALVDGAADGVVAFLRTHLDVEDLTVLRMHGKARYVPPTMLGYPRGRGIYNNAMATVRVSRFSVSSCNDAGLDLGSRDSAALDNGMVTNNQLGARITFEPKRLLERLRVSGNQQNFAAE